MMRTERLCIYPASREQMEAMIVSEHDGELKKAYSEMLESCLRHPDQWEWYAIWCQTANCGRQKTQTFFGNYASPTAQSDL